MGRLSSTAPNRRKLNNLKACSEKLLSDCGTTCFTLQGISDVPAQPVVDLGGHCGAFRTFVRHENTSELPSVVASDQ